MMQQLSNAAVWKGHVSDVEPSNSSNSEENDPTYECEEAKEEVAIHQPIKVARKRNKPLSQSKRDSTALVLVKATNSGKELYIVQEELALKSEGGAMAQLNGAQVEAVRSMGFASFLKVDVKRIPGKFSKWLMEGFDPYDVCFRLPDGQQFLIIAFNEHATLDIPFEGNENHRNDQVFDGRRNAPELTRMPEFILAQKDGGESSKRNFIIYLVNCFFSGPKNCYRSKSILKYLKDKANNDLYAPSFSPTVPLDKPDGEVEIPINKLVFDSSIIVEKEEHREDVVLDQPKSITKKDHSMPSYSLGLGLSQLEA
ncbi:hypothetical protein Cgig2_018580 [Carnegiea gigantea]|uniref:Uncharacterized protein n=1 Tax=Carnegiea gigantea TaxID=171969 RepID=A0A9Q1KLB1_9CARY|nr:hypothetical protein Cgig2_018580 [Carnegiea gigantea]